MFKLISLLRDLWQLRAENNALRSRVERLEREHGGAHQAHADPGAERELEQVRGELARARARLTRVKEIVFRTRHVERGVSHVQ